MEAKAVQSVGVGCGFDERRGRGDHGDHQDESGKCGPVGEWAEKKRSSSMIQKVPSSQCFSLLWFAVFLNDRALKNQHHSSISSPPLA